MLSLDDKIFIVIAMVRTSFRQRDAQNHGKNLPSKRVIQYVINNFEKYGTVEDRRKSYTVDRPRVLSPRKVKVFGNFTAISRI